MQIAPAAALPATTARLKSCRLCEARLETADAVELAVPRGVHFFLRADERQRDTAVTLRVTTCRYCGHLQSLDEPIIYEHQATSATYISGPLLAAREAQGRRTLALAAHPPRRILEVGCGDGRFLAALAPAMELVVGIEPSAASAAEAARRGVIVEHVLLGEHSRVAGAPFDAFFAFHVLEHVPEVKAFLRGIRNNLSTGAVGCIEVPSSEAAYEHARYGHFMTDHLSYFFAGTLRQAVESSGFEVIALEREWGGEHLVAYVRVRSDAAHRAVPQWVASTTARLAAFLREAQRAGRRVALWGASNPILPVLLHLPPELPYIVVDKAPTKHGLYAPGSHVRIFAPDELRRQRIDDVVITAPRFFAEIVAELRAGFADGVQTIDADVGVAEQICRLSWNAEDRSF